MNPQNHSFFENNAEIGVSGAFAGSPAAQVCANADAGAGGAFAHRFASSAHACADARTDARLPKSPISAHESPGSLVSDQAPELFGCSCKAVVSDDASRAPMGASRSCADTAEGFPIPTVQVRGYSFAYPPEEGDRRESCAVLNNVNLRVEQGAFCVLVGATGSGKTTLLRSLKPELAPVGESSGDIFVLGRSLKQPKADCAADQSANQPVNPAANPITPLESAQLIGYVMQDPSAQIVCDTVWHELAFGLENLGIEPDQMRRRIAEVAHFFDIEPWIRSKTEDLSGGQKQLVNLAAVLALRPRLLLLDEPTAQLDPNAVKQFLFMLSRVNRELGITVVMATHSPEDVRPYATQRIDLSEPGTISTFERAKAALSPYFDRRCAQLANADAALIARDVHFRFDRHAPWVLRGVEFRVRQGSVHALVGGNGCGKTTLLRCLAGVLSPQRGHIKNKLAVSQALLPQDPKALLVCDSVREELMEWASRCDYDEQAAHAMAQRFGLCEQLNRHPFDLSGGQQQKLAIAKLLLAQPRLLFLDEPTKGLDPASSADLSRIVKALAAEGKTIVLVTHDLDFAFATADEVSMLFDGEVACTEPVQDFFENNLIYRPNSECRFFGQIAKDGAVDGE